MPGMLAIAHVTDPTHEAQRALNITPDRHTACQADREALIRPSQDAIAQKSNNRSHHDDSGHVRVGCDRGHATPCDHAVCNVH